MLRLCFVVESRVGESGKSNRSAMMSRFRGRGNTATEGALMRLLRQHRIVGWRRHWRLSLAAPEQCFGLPDGSKIPRYCKPDFVFARAKVAILVDGCFWHGCPLHCRMPANNSLYWEAKITRNKIRDQLVTSALEAMGWRVLRIWEHELRVGDQSVKRIAKELDHRILRQRPRPGRSSLPTASGFPC
jgi:DNA mismatch endonuclease (patch repair protein)